MASKFERDLDRAVSDINAQSSVRRIMSRNSAVGVIAIAVAIVTVGVLIVSQHATMETITIAENDIGCLDKAVTEAALKKPVPWGVNLRGRKGFFLAWAMPFMFRESSLYCSEVNWSPGERARVWERDGDLACLEPIDKLSANIDSKGKCYWTAIGRPPSLRAAPMPSEESKPPYKKTLMDVAENEIEDALEAMGYEEMITQADKFNARIELLRKQAAPYASESEGLMSHRCVPDPNWKSFFSIYGDEGLCRDSEARFQRNYGLALRGDYEAQQKVIECFETYGRSMLPGCDGVVKTNKSLHCAWWTVLLANRDQRINDYPSFDVDWYQFQCVEKSTPTELAVVRAQAAALFERIYHKPLPKGF